MSSLHELTSSRPAPRLLALGAFLLLLLAPVLPASAADAPAEVPLRDGWRYRWGDSPPAADGKPAWAAQSGEEPEWAPMDALTEPPGRGGQSFLWLSIPVPAGPWEDPGVSLAHVTGAFEAYVGGERVFASGQLVPNGSEVMERVGAQLVRLPRSVLGKRVLLRFQSHQPTIGVFNGARVSSHHTLFVESLLAGAVQAIFGAFLLALAAGLLLVFMRWRQQRLLLHLVVFSAGAGLLLLGISGVPGALLDAHRAWYHALYVGAYALVPGFCAFFEAVLLQGRRPWARRGAVGLYALCGLLVLGTLVSESATTLLQPLYILCALGGQLTFGTVALLEARKGSQEARILLAGFVLYWVAAAVSTAAVYGLVSVGFVFHYGFLALALALLLVVSRRAEQVVRSLGAHTQALESQQKVVRTLAERMGQGAGELASAVQQLRAAGAEQNAGLTKQAAALQQAQATVEELRQVSQLTAEKAMLLAASASEAEDISREGAAAIESTLGGLEGIRDEVSGMSQRIVGLEARTREIASIVDTVKGLADQSNMLALNAAIEAVRSGEHGKGFSVVAREVRNLADQSIDATERIREVLGSVGESVTEAARLGKQGEERVRVSLEGVRTSGAQLRRLADFVGETGEGVRQMTAAIAQQDAGTSQMATGIGDLSAQMQQTLTALEQTEAATRSVQQLAEGMAAMAAEALQTSTR